MAKKRCDVNVDETLDIEVKENPLATKKTPEKPIAAKPVKTNTQKCQVLAYYPQTKELDVSFGGYGIRFKSVDRPDGDYVYVNYKGEIGKPGFSYELK